MFIQEELSIKAMTISQIYSLYCSDKLIVNRRYQRKLCWTIEEKRNFLDTIERGFPVPMFLLATNENGQYEIIDGMQRLDAICSFISQRYQLKSGFFNLESMPDTIEMKRNKVLTQKNPCIDATVCKDIANYPLPVSVFPAATRDDIEEVFKRINSTGKHLALQELRQVGVDTPFSNIVRELSAEIRGDISDDVLLLKNMSNISISNYRLPYSIFVDSIFWVKSGVINHAEIRQSRDEEAIAYVVANMEMTQINNAIDRVGEENVKKQFRIVMSCIQDMLEASGKTLRQILNAPKTISDLIIPFEIIFLAVHQLVIRDKKTVVDYNLFAKKLDGNCSHIVRSDPKRQGETIDAIAGLIQTAFTKGKIEDPALDNWSLELVNILNKSRSEQVLYDYKIGLVPFKGNKLDSNMVEKVLKTLTAINNAGPGRAGYVIVGVADTEEDANKYQQEYGIKYTMVNELPLCGIEHDAIAIAQDIDRYTHTVKEYIKQCTSIPEAYKMHILTQMKTPIAYGKHTFVFKTNYTEPVPYNNEYYLREFSDVTKLTPAQIPTLFTNYYGKN